MTPRELDRLKGLTQAIQHKLTWLQVGAQLARSVRQVGRLCARVRLEGYRGILHPMIKNAITTPDALRHCAGICRMATTSAACACAQRLSARRIQMQQRNRAWVGCTDDPRDA